MLLKIFQYSQENAYIVAFFEQKMQAFRPAAFHSILEKKSGDDQ